MTTGPTPPSRPRAFRLAPDEAAALPTPSPTSPVRGEEPVSRPAPRAYRLNETDAVDRVEIADQPDPYVREIEQGLAPARSDEAAIEEAQGKGMARRGVLSLGALFWSAVVGLVSLGVGLWITKLIDDLFARLPGLGWLGVALVAVAVFALAAIGVREIIGIGRQRHVAVLHKKLAQAHAADDGKAARALIPDLAALYEKRPDTAAARKDLTALAGEIIDGRDLVDLAERHLMAPLDRAVRREIADAAKRVSLVTAISPRAMLDLVFVVAQIVRLIRRIAEIYSGRPGLLGFLRLARSVGMHLAITGGMAVGESVLQQAIGHGLAAKLSARLGEGVLNGILTTRVGLSAMAVCRPMPFAALKQPGAKEVAPFLFGGDGAP
jgi:putative membrane protein